MCPECNSHNFANNSKCYSCEYQRNYDSKTDKGMGYSELEMDIMCNSVAPARTCNTQNEYCMITQSTCFSGLTELFSLCCLFLFLLQLCSIIISQSAWFNRTHQQFLPSTPKSKPKLYYRKQLNIKLDLLAWFKQFWYGFKAADLVVWMIQQTLQLVY